ncbi:MAG: ABC transporter substrate-binding protein [Aquabacterium sp.]
MTLDRAATRPWWHRAPLLLAALALMGTLAQPTQAQTTAPAGPTLRIATAFDPQTMDPHGLALLYHSRVVFQIYDCLVNRSEDFKLEPGLATEWRMVNPTTWRFKLRAGVSFHDGTPFTADDAVFSIERAWARPSQRSFHFTGLTAVRKVDAEHIEFSLSAPDAVWPEKLVFVAMMSKAWSEKHGAAKAQDFNAKQEMHTVRNANGTGPFRLARYEPDVRVTLARHAGWWGKGDQRNGNVTEVSFVSVKSDATRLAALSSGEVDLVLDPPFQDIERLKTDPRISVTSVPDIGTQYFTFDQVRNELLHGDVKDRNPFKDKRVRQAVGHALNIDLIIQKVLRGQAVPAGSLVSPLVEGYAPDMDKRLAYDPARARALLAEAGYANGFGVTLDCVNVAWREAVCQAAAAMLTQVGIRTQVRSSPTNQFFPKLSQANASFVEYGWTASPDGWSTLNGLFRTWEASGGGTFNAGRYSNPQVDVLIDAVRTEPDLVKRRARVGVVLRMVSDDLAYLPLYRRKLNWAMARKVTVVQWPNDMTELRWARVR